MLWQDKKVWLVLSKHRIVESAEGPWSKKSLCLLFEVQLYICHSHYSHIKPGQHCREPAPGKWSENLDLCFHCGELKEPAHLLSNHQVTILFIIDPGLGVSDELVNTNTFLVTLNRIYSLWDQQALINHKHN